MRFFIPVLIMLTATAAQAAEQKPVLDPATCHQLSVDYQPPADIHQKADLTPEVDAQGKPVIEADLNPSGVVVPQVVTFDVSVLTARFLGLKSPAALKEEAIVGRLSVDTKTGQTSFNGQPIGRGVDLETLRALCPAEDVSSKVTLNAGDLKNPDNIDIKNPEGTDVKNPAGVSNIKNPENKDLLNPKGIDVKTGK